MDDIRDSLRAFLEQNPLWDRDVFAVQVTDFREFAVEIRLLATNSRAPRVFTPRCEIREYLAA
ncbi:MAG: hypothetical protein II336_15830 [Loktanella sp.]|nr:hypothetical protein [Loktanella sp.]